MAAELQVSVGVCFVITSMTTHCSLKDSAGNCTKNSALAALCPMISFNNSLPILVRTFTVLVLHFKDGLISSYIGLFSLSWAPSSGFL